MRSRSVEAHDSRLGWRVRLLLGTYPPWWRIRYDDEMRDTVLALRDEGRWNAKGSRDLVRGLMSAWVNPTSVPSEEGMPQRDRRLVPFAAWGLLLFVLGGLGFAKMLDYPEFTDAANKHPALSWSVTALIGVAICTTVVMTVCAAAAATALMRQRERLWQAVRPLLAVPVSVAALAATLVIARAGAGGPTAAHGRQVAAFVALVGVAVVCGVVCTVALMNTALRVPESRTVALSRRIALVSVGGLTAIGALSVLAWTLVAASQTPSLLRADEGLVSTPTLLTVCVSLTLLFAGAGLSVRASMGANPYRGSPRIQQPRSRSAK